MKNTDNAQINPQTQSIAKFFSIGCGAFGGIFLCALVTILPLTMLPLVAPTTFTFDEFPLNLTAVIVLVVIIGAILGGVVGYFLFFRLAFKGSANQMIVRQRAFDQAVENAVEEKLQEREDRS